MHELARRCYAIGMLRLLLILCLIHAPLSAVALAGDPTVSLSALRINLDVSTKSCSATCSATLHNGGDEAVTASLTFPETLVPKAEREAFPLKIAGIERQGALRWDVVIESGQSVEVTWSLAVQPVNLPYAHPQGLLEYRIPLAHMRGYTELPKTMTITVTPVGIDAELFLIKIGRQTQVEIGSHIEDHTVTRCAESWQTCRDRLETLLKDTDETRRTHTNRSYTETLVHLADLYTLRDHHELLAEVCESLAALEASGGVVINHCGPWAKWRRHVPWQLRRMHALKAAGKDETQAARDAVASVADVWAAHLAAHEKAQPFDHFDRKRFGAYWDYDWPRTRELYADALEILGDAKAAETVRELE